MRMSFLLLVATTLLATSSAEAKTGGYPIRTALYAGPMSDWAEFKNCIFRASVESHVEELLLMAVIRSEGGRPHTRSKNRDGTTDYSIMQINDVRMPELIKLGFDPQRVKHDACYNIRAGAAILGKEIQDSGDLWTGVGNYHYSVNGKYPNNHYKYRMGVRESLEFLLKKLLPNDERYTYNIADK